MKSFLLVLGGFLTAGHPLMASPGAPPLREVLEVLRTNLPALSEADLNQAAVDGLLHQLRGRASLVTGSADTNAALTSFSVVEPNIGVARVAQINSRLAAELTAGVQAAASTNKLEGLVLDLRFVAGDDYAATVRVARLFVSDNRPLMDWGSGMQTAGNDPATIQVPLAVLINRETLGAAEALAGALREANVAVLIGNPTAGRALAGGDIDLGEGYVLRVANTPVKLGDGTTVPEAGVTPDIAIPVALEQERSLRDKPFAPAASSEASTNSAASRPARTPRVNEADLVRERRAATNQNQSPQSGQRANPQPRLVIVDPPLARAVDLLKALAVIHRNGS